MFLQATQAVANIFISGCLDFPSRWGSCLQCGQAGTGLCNCCISLSVWSFCTSDPFSRQGNLNLPACVTCLGAKARLNIGVFGEISPTFHGLPPYGEVWLLILFSLVVFSEMFLSLESCRYPGIWVTRFPTVLNLQNGKVFSSVSGAD